MHLLSKQKLLKIISTILLLSALVFFLAGCSAQGGRQGAINSDLSNGFVDTPKINIAMVSHAVAGDIFWDTVRKGAQQAANKSNVNLVYANDAEGGRQAQLVQQFVDQKFDAIIVSLAKPNALKEVLQNAQAANIPVVTINSGSEYFEDFGALAHFGQEEIVAGREVGKQLNKENFVNAICVIHEQGQVGLESRCAGVRETFQGELEILYVNGANMPQTSATVTAKLQTNTASDVIIGLSAPITLNIVKSVADMKSPISVVSFDLNKQLVEAILAQEVLFTVDQQPYLQGYLAVDALWLNILGDFQVGSGIAVSTGPQIVTAENIDEIAQFVEKGLR